MCKSSLDASARLSGPQRVVADPKIVVPKAVYVFLSRTRYGPGELRLRVFSETEARVPVFGRIYRGREVEYIFAGVVESAVGTFLSPFNRLFCNNDNNENLLPRLCFQHGVVTDT